MNYFDLNGNSFSLGGLASGKIHIDEKGKIDASRLFGIDGFPVFAIKAFGSGMAKSLVLQGEKNSNLTFGCFENSTCKCAFPFYNLSLGDNGFPAKVELCAFNPLLILNDTDSGIPAAFLEFEVENTSDEKLNFSICSICQNPFKNGSNRMGCSESGEAYIFLSGNEKNMCISTDEKNISFCENISSLTEFEKSFTLYDTLENISCDTKDKSGAVCAHFSLEKGQKHMVRFIISWFIPQNGSCKNYYTNYFESSVECSSYCFGHYDRLRGESQTFAKLIFDATLPKNVLENVNRDLICFSEQNISRLSNGSLVTEDYEKFSDMNSFICRSGILCSLFPLLEYSQAAYLYKNCLGDNGEILFNGENNPERQLLLILRSYRKYILSADVNELIEDWYYIVKAFDFFCGDENALRLDKNGDGRISVPSLQLTYSACIYAMGEMANAVKDKKRYEKYSAMYKNAPMQEAIDYSIGFSRLCEYSGFCYDATVNHIGFAPLSNECPLDFGGTFRCPFFTPDGYGYVEEGIDYIEINMIKGSLFIRSFGVPRVPRLVQYGGRNWKFENKENVALLDSELEVTQSKKLTILIDIK